MDLSEIKHRVQQAFKDLRLIGLLAERNVDVEAQDECKAAECSLGAAADAQKYFTGAVIYSKQQGACLDRGENFTISCYNIMDVATRRWVGLHPRQVGYTVLICLKSQGILAHPVAQTTEPHGCIEVDVIAMLKGSQHANN